MPPAAADGLARGSFRPAEAAGAQALGAGPTGPTGCYVQ